MDMLKFIAFSSLENFSLFMMIIIQFRFSLKENLAGLILFSLLISFVSYSFIHADLRGISSFVQLGVMFMYPLLVMKVSITNSIIMVSSGYIAFGMIQTCILAVFSHIGLGDGIIHAGSNIAYQGQFYSAFITFALCYLIYRFKGGFSFIEPRSRFSKKSFSGKNKWFLIYIFIVFFITMLSNIVLVETNRPPYLTVAMVLLLALIVLFIMTIKRDESVD